MSKDPSLNRSQAVEQVLAQLDGPIEVNELCRRALAIWPSTAKNPLPAMRSHIRQDHAGKTLVFVDDKMVLPIRIAMKGVRFRIPLSRMEANRGVLIIRPAFDRFLRREIDPEAVQLVDSKGHSLPTRLTTIKQQVDGPFGKHTVEYAAFDLGKWFRERGAGRKDSIIVTVEDWMMGRFRLEHEPTKRRRAKECERQDQEFADLLFGMLESARNEVIYSHVAIPTAYARMSDPRGYPGSHWVEIVDRDPRMRSDGWAIHYSDWRAPLERMLYEDKPVPQVAFSPEQGRQVYRFKVALEYRPGLWRVVEIQGRQTLADFDRILRDAFRHDFSDHLGGFWKRVRRGKSKRFREIEVGTVDPFGGGNGADTAIAGLGLEPGQELKYVYDFGDWIEHRITLEKILDPQKEAKYPRVVDQNKPRYEKCESCRARGRDSRATWICVECSNRQQRDVLLCRDCLVQAHEEHYAEEILY